jgi:hypothetical protein
MSVTTEHSARKLIELVNSRNLDKVMERIAEDATFQVPSLAAPLKGKEAIRSYLRSTYTAFPDWRMAVSKLIISGGDSIMVNSIHGTNSGPLTGPDGIVHEPTNRKFSQDQLTLVTFDVHDKMLSLRAYGNVDEVTRQLGIRSPIEDPVSPTTVVLPRSA